jgi:2-dehydro-3-deoxyphosphogluconate aldolase/(4S)-4-hydroxy-2-oxoglutarate aldolase
VEAPPSGCGSPTPAPRRLTRIGSTIDGATGSFEAGRLLGIVRFPIPGDLDGTVTALTTAGIGLLEITLDTPGALPAIERAASRGSSSIGAGTVLRVEQVRACADAGARFVVSPGCLPDVVGEAHALGLAAIPGALSPTEILTAESLGAEGVKLFPAALGGPAYLRTLRGPFPATRFVPTGGIGLEDAPAYLEAGATCVGLGASLVGRTPPASASELRAIEERAGRAIALAAAGPRPG